MKTAISAILSTAIVVQSATTTVPQCELLTIPVTVSGIQQKNLSGPIDYSTYDGTYQSFPNLVVSGTYNISASLCTPKTTSGTRSSTLQILVHGAGYNKTYWSGLKTPPQSFNGSTYSWVDYAASEGYSTLAIDRLCNGNSSRPDAANVCQAQTQAAVIHQLVQRARNGTLSRRSPKTFTTIIFVGHSFGSQLGSYYLNTFPNDINATILTGFSNFAGPGAQGTTFATGLRPARDTFARYAALQPTYLTNSDSNTVQTTFYYGSYNREVSALDYQGIGTIPIGEFLSFSLGLDAQPNVRIPVFLLNGQNDQIFCATSVLDGLNGAGGQCGEGASSLTARSKSLFPNAAAFSYYNVANTGHCLNLHYSAPIAFAAAQKFLNSQRL